MNCYLQPRDHCNLCGYLLGCIDFHLPVAARAALPENLHILSDQAVNADVRNFARWGREGGLPLSHPLAAIPGLHPIWLRSSADRACESPSSLRFYVELRPTAISPPTLRSCSSQSSRGAEPVTSSGIRRDQSIELLRSRVVGRLCSDCP